MESYTVIGHKTTIPRVIVIKNIYCSTLIHSLTRSLKRGEKCLKLKDKIVEILSLNKDSVWNFMEQRNPVNDLQDLCVAQHLKK